jgi:hypothetical protein
MLFFFFLVGVYLTLDKFFYTYTYINVTLINPIYKNIIIYDLFLKNMCTQICYNKKLKTIIINSLSS